MRTIRNSVFETNSSSCHVVTVLSDYEIEEIKNGESLLAIYKSQNEKTITKTFDNFRFRYEIERYQFSYDYSKNEPKYIDIPRETMKELCDKIWKLLVEDSKNPIEYFTVKLDAIFAEYKLDEDFVDSVKAFIGYFAGKSTLDYIFERLQKYEMPNGEIMNFSCVELEC